MTRESWRRKYDGDCYGWALNHVRPGDAIVHGTVVFPLTRERGGHAWIERKGRVYDNNLANFMKDSLPVPDYYRAMQAEADDRYTDYEVQVYTLRTGRPGPWTENERGSKPEAPKRRRTRVRSPLTKE